MKPRRLTAVLCLVSGFLGAPGAQANDRARAGELILERPTLHSLGFEWRVEGDANGNAGAAVRYRKKGAAEWRQAMEPFRTGLGVRIDNSMIGRGAFYVLPDALAGSIFDLEPGTDYEVELALEDPDGVEGPATRTFAQRTRPEPSVPGAPVEVRHVYPPGHEGAKEKPAFENVMHAVNGYPPICDTYQTLHPHAAKPGTVIKVHGGLHTYDNNLYWKNNKPQFSYWLHGMITLVANGTPAQPIFIVAAGDGEPVFDGGGAAVLFNVRSADYLHFEGLTVRNCDMAFFGGFQGERGGGCKGLTVKDCRIEGVITGILAQDGRSEDFAILDNTITGRNPADKLGHFGSTTAGYAVNLGGQGHAVGHNRAANFWDGINVFTSALADPALGQQARAIDIYNNDIANCSDQFIEADGGYANIRVLRNRMFNCPSQPVSCQPVHAGPVYWIRNILWNVCGGRMNMKNNNGTQAYAFLHNTSSTHMKMPPNQGYPPEKTFWRIHNNLCVGPGGNGLALAEYAAAPPDPRRAVSHNAYNRAAGNAPCKIGKENFPSLDAMRAGTGFDRGSIFVDGYEVFAKAAEPPHAKGGTPLAAPDSVDLSPKPGAGAVDAGIAIPGVNDGFAGRAPDIGALEAGRPPPTYGPRTGGNTQDAATRAATITAP